MMRIEGPLRPSLNVRGQHSTRALGLNEAYSGLPQRYLSRRPKTRGGVGTS
jgi:hypothetical protein